MKRQPFPLQWPEGWARTRPGNQTKSKFGHKGSGQVSLSGALYLLQGELQRLGASNVVITSDLPVRNDGLPYADGRATDPGIAVWFVMVNRAAGRAEERVFACDKWKSPAENMQAIALSVEAMRGLSRWGAGDVVSRAFAGFAALPPPSGPESPQAPAAPPKREWRDVLGWTAGSTAPAPWPELGNEELLAIAKHRHRALIQRHHPDRGGDVQFAAELNAALAEAEQELVA